jgi:polysaccharide chain length determinant protein (PEP-CTERM system associated)
VLFRKYTFAEVWNLFVTNRWLILIPMAIGLAAAPLLGLLTPLRYRSEALILVVPQQVSDNIVKSTVGNSVADRLPAITAQILSRSRLERIILEMDLYKEERSRQVMEDVVEQMRLKDVKTSATGPNIDSFRVSFENESAEVAQRVTERLTRLYVEQNALERASQADNTSDFLAKEIERTKQRLSEQDKLLAEYRKAHPGQLPSQLPANMQSIQNLGMQLQQAMQAGNFAQERRIRLERELANMEEVAPAAIPGAPANEPITPAAQLDAARADLARLKQKYGANHPDIDKAQRKIEELTAKLESETPLSAGSPPPRTMAELQLEQRRKGLLADLEVLNLQLKKNAEDQERLKRQISEFEGRVAVAPTREQELTDLTREYTTLNASYNDLLLKRETAALSASLERRKIGENFNILDPASRPERPYNELQRLGVMSSGVLGGLVLALFVIALREYRDSSFRSKDEVEMILTLPVLASIPVMKSAREREVAVRKKWAMDLGGSAVVVASVVFVAVWQLYS